MGKMARMGTTLALLRMDVRTSPEEKTRLTPWRLSFMSTEQISEGRTRVE